ncbi:hypothetical protein CAC42_7408 [Sphaceloma murrayae]|uniref:U3 small nucleolar RNA-associated protein 25 n=1 Tax=Sphaceloma murrayae TaxID=2082308 RepID=A0A2K1QWY6_9PEZI|nr:hypothetical protein CAC42_7408 [Sphaceloma murrayae]
MAPRGAFRGSFRGSNRGRTEKRKPFKDSLGDRNHQSKFEETRLPSPPEDINGGVQASSDDDEAAEATPSAYSTLLQTLSRSGHDRGQPRKRRKLSTRELDGEVLSNAEPMEKLLHNVIASEHEDLDESDEVASLASAAQGQDESLDHEEAELVEEGNRESDYDQDDHDPFTERFAVDEKVTELVRSIGGKKWLSTVKERGGWKYVWQHPDVPGRNRTESKYRSIEDLVLKQRLKHPATTLSLSGGPETSELLTTIFNYQSLLHGGRTPSNGSYLRDLTCLHALNHVLKGRDKVIRNNEKLAKAGDEVPEELDVRDQGFTRPKVLVLLETRQQCYRWITSILHLFEPEQRENWGRFKDEFGADDHVPLHLPEDYRDLFEGNSDNDFRIGLKFTRKTIKFFSAFYQSDILLCSALGLRRIIAATDPKKRDHDFLSSIEIAVLDQADAMLQQNWSHVTFVLSHLNLTPRDSHGADFTRVRPFYLDNQAQYFRQTLVYSSYVTPELQSLFNSLLSISGRLKLTPLYPGAITTLSHPLKQTFTRYHSPTPSSDPDTRFTFFTATLVPWISKLASLSSSSSPAGILIFIPSYLDFVRVRNYFAASPATENISFGQVSEYAPVSDQRRAKSHFVTGRNQVLLYSGRAHHFQRGRVRGVKRVVWYALPDNERFWGEVLGWVAEGVREGRTAEGEVACRAVFGKWDRLRLERIVGSERVGRLVEGEGDTFEFV